MKTIIMTVLAVWMAGHAMASDLPWLTSVPEAMAQAKSEGKSVLLDFTGSDWCGWCKKLDADTFSKPEFIDYAARNLVLVEVDFPKHKTQTAELKEANKALAEKYGVHGYPSLVDLAPDGTVLWKQTGYLKGGPEAMIAKLDEVNPKPNGPRSANPAVSVDSPPVAPRKAGGEPRLQGIYWSSSHPAILLEGKTCGEGDSVAGMRVVKIDKDKVTVQWKGTTKELVMK